MFIIFELRKDFFKNINVQEEKWKEKQKLEKLVFLLVGGEMHIKVVGHYFPVLRFPEIIKPDGIKCWLQVRTGTPVHC